MNISSPIQYIAAKAIIKNGDGNILVLKQSSEAAVENANRYHPPGGIVEPGELLHQALSREIQEELGLTVNIGDVLAVEEWRTNIRGQECNFVGIFYACTIENHNEIQLDEESSGYEWIDENSLARVDIIEPSLSVIKKAFKL